MMGRDVSVISRRLKSLAERTPFLAKHEKQWRLTASGRRFNDWTRRAIAEQESLITAREKIVIATTREFSSLVMSPSIRWWNEKLPHFEIITTDEGIESLILKGAAHFGFDCGTPYSPQVAFKRGPKEEFCLVYSPSLKLKKNSELHRYPLYFYNRLDITRFREATGISDLKAQLSFNDMASTRSALIHGEGWSILPTYVVANEVKMGNLKVLLKTVEMSSLSFGLWWNRELAPDKESLDLAFEWLSKQKLH